MGPAKRLISQMISRVMANCHRTLRAHVTVPLDAIPHDRITSEGAQSVDPAAPHECEEPRGRSSLPEEEFGLVAHDHSAGLAEGVSSIQHRYRKVGSNLTYEVIRIPEFRVLAVAIPPVYEPGFSAETGGGPKFQEMCRVHLV